MNKGLSLCSVPNRSAFRATTRLPSPALVIVQQIINRNAVVANVARDERKRMAATALRLGMFVGR